MGFKTNLLWSVIFGVVLSMAVAALSSNFSAASAFFIVGFLAFYFILMSNDANTKRIIKTLEESKCQTEVIDTGSEE